MKNILKSIIGVTLLFVAIGENIAAAEQSDQSVYLIIDFDVLPQSRGQFEQLMAGVKNAMSSEEGFEDANVFFDADAPNRFILIERWTTRELHRQHYDRIVASGEWSGILAMLKAAPKMSYTRLFAD